MHIISKQGSADNVLTYEHICDTSADMAKIDRKYITLGSVCIVLAGESGAMEVYMADSNKEWHDILVSSGNNTPSGLSIHICTQNEISNGKPNIEFPLETELYLVPSGAETGNLYDEYMWVNGAWELFGGARVNLTGYATEAWVSQQGYLTSHQDISALALKSEIPSQVSALQNDSGYLTSFTETDPTVPAWAKAPQKPTYTAQEVGALPADTQIPTVPTNISAFTNDANYLSNPEATTMVENWLESNITSGNVIDASLTIEGAGADAKKTGDEISNLKSAINELESIVGNEKVISYINDSELFTVGKLNHNGTVNTAVLDWRVTDYLELSEYFLSPPMYHIGTQNNEILAAYFDSSKSFISIERATETHDGQNDYGEGYLSVPETAKYVRIGLKIGSQPIETRSNQYIVFKYNALEPKFDELNTLINDVAKATDETTSAIADKVNRLKDGSVTSVSIDPSTIVWVTGKSIDRTGAEVSSNTKMSEKIAVDGDVLEVVLYNNSSHASAKTVYVLYDSEDNEIVRYQIAGITSRINISGASYIRFNYAQSWLTVLGVTVYTVNEEAQLSANAIGKLLGVNLSTGVNIFNKQYLYKGYVMTSGKKFLDYLDGQVHHSSLWTMFVRFKKNAVYTLYTGGTVDRVSYGIIYVDKDGFVQNDDNQNIGISFDYCMSNENCKFVIIKTTVDFDDEKYKYIGVRTSASVLDFDNVVIVEGNPWENNLALSADDLIVQDYTTVDNLLITPSNLDIETAERLARSVQYEDLYTSFNNAYNYYSANEVFDGNFFTIGALHTLMRSVRAEKQIRESRIQLSSNFGHVTTVLKQGDKLYISYLENTNNGYDAPTPDETRGATLQIRLAIVDIATWALEKTLVIMKKDDTCGNMTISTGAGDPNAVMIDADTVRITGSAKTSDGNWRLLYRDYSISNDTLGDIGTATIVYNGTTYEMTSEIVNTAIVQTNYRSMFYLSSQYAKDGNTYYIVLGEDEAISGGIILTTNDFIEYTVWLVPEVEGLAMKYEGACMIQTPAGQQKTLFVAYRQSNYSDLRIVKYQISDKTVTGNITIPDTGSRPCWIQQSNSSVQYIMHSLNDRMTSNIEAIKMTNFRVEGTVTQGYTRTYPSVVLDSQQVYISFSAESQVWVARFVFKPFLNTQAIEYINRLLDLLEGTYAGNADVT